MAIFWFIFRVILKFNDGYDDDWFDYSFLDSEGDLQEKPVINGQMTENLKQTTGQTTERTVENGKNPINAPEW